MMCLINKEASNLIVGYLMTLIITWFAWCLGNFTNYLDLSGIGLSKTLIHDFLETFIESFFLYCFAVISCKVLLRLLWNRRENNITLALIVIFHAILNFIFVLGVAYIYLVILPFEKNIFHHILITDYFTIEALTSIYVVLSLIKKTKDEEREKVSAQSESRKKEIIALQTKLDMLTLQTNNHFIFNSFSTAASLVRHHPEAAESFIKRLASMYRYMTQNCDKHVVHLDDELEFVNTYVQMLEGRYFGIVVKISPQLYTLNAFVPPASVQSLVENAVKHNSHGLEKTLKITVSLDGESIVITNNVIKRYDDISGAHTGINNLKNRYKLLTEKEVQFESDGQTFKVTMPLIFEEDLIYEGPDYRR